MLVDSQCPGLDVLGGVDVDGDGVLERIVAAGGSTARYAWLYDQTCSPLPRASGADGPGFLVGAGGSSCAPTGCHVAVTCDPGERYVTVRIVSPAEPSLEILAEDEAALVDVHVETQTWALGDGVFQMVETIEEIAPYGEVDVSMAQAEESLIGCDR